MAVKGKDFKKLLSKLKLSQARGGKFLGYSARQARRIAGGHNDLSVAAEKLMKVMIHLGLSPEVVETISSGGKPKPMTKPSAKKGASASTVAS